jgi:hypothetical protein
MKMETPAVENTTKNSTLRIDNLKKISAILSPSLNPSDSAELVAGHQGRERISPPP